MGHQSPPRSSYAPRNAGRNCCSTSRELARTLEALADARQALGAQGRQRIAARYELGAVVGLVGRDAAMEMLLEGRILTATEALAKLDADPAEIARNAYAGLMENGERIFPRDALRDGNFEVVVSGVRKGVGSSRETAVQAEKWSGGP